MMSINSVKNQGSIPVDLRTVDDPIREEALNTHHSYIVQAPAGSGKTTLLIQRMLALLTQVEKPEECLAITFTRKAAGEMRHRILAALHSAENQEHTRDETNSVLEGPAGKSVALAKKVLQRDKLKGWNLQQNPSRLKVHTVDALCATLARQLPILSQLGAMPSIAEDPEVLYQEAATNVLLSLNNEDSKETRAVKHVLLHLDNNLEFARRLLSEMLSLREQWLPYLPLSSVKEGKLREIVEQGLQAAIEKELYTVKSALSFFKDDQQELLALMKYAGQALTEQGSPSPITQGVELTISHGLGMAVDDLEMWKGIAELLLTEKNEFRKIVTVQQGFRAPTQCKNKVDKMNAQIMKQRMQDLLKKFENEKGSELFRHALSRIRICPPAHYSEQAWKVVEGIITVLPSLAAHLALVFQAKGQVDFAEVSLAASRALQENEGPSDLALILDYTIRHILVDEFQDISIPQQRLLEQLISGWQPNEGRTLFLVGDPQQSIYRFRQAEVGLFLHAKTRGLAALPLIPLRLTVNFRSTPEVVSWINSTFQTKFPNHDDISMGSVAFCPSVAKSVAKEGGNNHELTFDNGDNKEASLQNSPRDPLQNSSVIVHEMINQEKEANVEANTLIQCLLEARALNPLGSQALLVRSRSHLKTLIPVLKKHGIPYQGVEIEPFREHPLTHDLFSLTKALLHLGDKIAWLSLLRMPGVALPLNDVFLLARHEPRLPLWHTLKNYTEVKNISLEAHDILKIQIPQIVDILNHQVRWPFPAWLQYAWNTLYQNRTFDIEEIAIQNHFFNLLADEQLTSDGFYDVSALERRVASSFVPEQPHTKEVLQIMTIHKAKGLEFDTVIVAGIDRRSKSDPEKLFLWEQDLSLAGKPYLIVAPIRDRAMAKDPVYHYLKTINKERAHFEEMRLLYVASTRAKKRLYWLVHK